MISKTLKDLCSASMEAQDDLHPESTNKADDATGKGKPEMVIDVETVDETYKEGKVPKADVEVAEKIEASTEAILAAVEASLEDGGLDKTGLALARVSVESVAAIMGVRPEVVMSFEAFDDEEGDRIEATKASLESLRPIVSSVSSVAQALRDRIATEE